ncbi:MAG: IPExxxVDY family protein [Bacteroidales bacterium]|jgi:hypothetical protein|nr:hypothetical protein [Lentimicrobiaceae bacterium]MDG1136414.1 IPExxxVDY family protein [Bacteroidales bacterium]MDG2081876.1 IPExxxVDY family protein [Bacteroidales bacterium]|tara:strand:+ start:5683 stop:6141 length:459 start_codon:yes stop_codon:yes gene_type:complete
MSKKLSRITNYFDGFHLYAIVSHLKDYSLCFHINNKLGFDLVNYEDLVFDLSGDPNQGFSWYYYKDYKTHTHFYLIGNKSEGNILLPSQKTVDFLLLIKDAIDDNYADETSSAIRKILNISAVFQADMGKIKDMDLLMETIELHELKFVKHK